MTSVWTWPSVMCESGVWNGSFHGNETAKQGGVTQPFYQDKRTGEANGGTLKGSRPVWGSHWLLPTPTTSLLGGKGGAYEKPVGRAAREKRCLYPGKSSPSSWKSGLQRPTRAHSLTQGRHCHQASPPSLLRDEKLLPHFAFYASFCKLYLL